MRYMSFFKKKRIFLDYAAGTDNSSAIYEEGAKAKKVLEDARTKIARILEVQARDIVFTSGGTEADNLAMLGVFEKSREKVTVPHVVISSIEHPAISECAKEIVRRGGEVTVVEAEEGIVSAEAVLKAVKENTVLVSIMYANNETGAIQPVGKIARLIAEYKKANATKFPYMHTDASQAGNFLSLNMSSIGVDLMTLDASKMSGPKGAGLLVIRPHVELMPILFGGGQERGLRSGTENISAIVAFADALEVAQKNKTSESERLEKLKNIFIAEIKKELPEVIINTPEKNSLPNIVSVSFPNVLHEFVAIQLDEKGVCVSTGSSCNSTKDQEEKAALRFSFGRETTEKEVREAIRVLKEIML
jgi:cysteine desulfurase